MTGSCPTSADERFQETVFRRLPLAFMAAAAAAGGILGPAWSEAAGPLPWVFSLAAIGLPHGAADFAASRRTWRGWALVVVWLAYVATMAAVVAAFAVGPVTTIVAFAGVSCWHFGAAHLDTERAAGGEIPLGTGSPGPLARASGVLARGCIVLALPLIAWPKATTAAATDLAAVVVGRDAADGLFPPVMVWSAGLALAAITVVAALAALVSDARHVAYRRPWWQLPVELAVIAALGWYTDPLFSVGVYFLVWHAWRQMEPLAESLGAPPCHSWRQLTRAVIGIHAAALPLLLPTWAAIATAWWLGATDQTLRSLAIVSIAAYLIVTPAHEMLGDLLRTMASKRASGPGQASTAAIGVPPPPILKGRPLGAANSCS